MSFGVALSVKANLGISPISCIPYILFLRFSLSIGQFTIIFNAILILLQILLLRKKYKIFQLVQLPIIFLFGFFIDFAVFITANIEVIYYLPRLLLCLLSCLIIGIGVFIEVQTKISYLPGEGLSLAISEVTGLEFGKAKIIVDCSMVLTGVLGSFFLLGTLQGIREGTVLAAVLVGLIARTLGGRINMLKQNT